MDPEEAWTLVDPTANASEQRHILRHVLGRAASGWTATSDVESLRAPLLDLPLLARHRVLTAVDLDAIPGEVLATARGRIRTILTLQMQLEAACKHTVSVLDDAGIETRVLKGVGSAQLDYPLPELRHSGDLDLAVPPDALLSATLALEEQGFERLVPSQPVRRGSRGVTLVSPTGIHIDLHNRLLTRSPPAGELFDQAGDPIAALGTSALPVEWRFVHAAVHWLTTKPSLRRASGLVDVVSIAVAHSLNDDAVRHAARVLRVERIVDHSTNCVDALLSDFSLVQPVVNRLSDLERRAFAGPDDARFAWTYWNHGLRIAYRSPVARAHNTWYRMFRAQPASAPPDDPPICVSDRSSLGPDSIVVICPDARQRCLIGEVVIHQASSQAVVVLDGPGAFLWSELRRQPTTARGLAKSIALVADIHPDRAIHDAMQFLTQLLELRFVEVAGEEVVAAS